jgi:hypothetical protein
LFSKLIIDNRGEDCLGTSLEKSRVSGLPGRKRSEFSAGSGGSIRESRGGKRLRFPIRLIQIF